MNYIRSDRTTLPRARYACLDPDREAGRQRGRQTQKTAAELGTLLHRRQLRGTAPMSPQHCSKSPTAGQGSYSCCPVPDEMGNSDGYPGHAAV
jgi:hypothetical protein